MVEMVEVHFVLKGTREYFLELIVNSTSFHIKKNEDRFLSSTSRQKPG